MKILLINNDKGWSGGQEHLKDLTGELLRHGVEVHFVAREGSKSDNLFRKLGVPVHAIPGHGWGDMKALIKLVRLFQHERFDIVSINREHDLFLTAIAWKLAFPLRKHGKLMMSYHTATARKQLLLGSADAIVCISEHVRTKLLQGNPTAAGKISLLYYGIKLGEPPALDKFNIDRPRRFFTGMGFPIIGMLGEFWKNQKELVEIIPSVKKVFPSLKVCFVGDNSDKFLLEPLKSRISELGLDENVYFTGRVPRDKIPDIFHDFELSVTTHRNEGFGIVHLESLSAGTPVVAYNEGGFVDILKGENAGILVDGGKSEFAAAVVDLLRNHKRRFAMGTEGYELVMRKYSIQSMGQTYLSFYRNLIKK